MYKKIRICLYVFFSVLISVYMWFDREQDAELILWILACIFIVVLFRVKECKKASKDVRKAADFALDVGLLALILELGIEAIEFIVAMIFL